jgi:hypothetical protein
VVDLTPALRDELALWLDCSPFKQPTDLVFGTLKGRSDSRQNVWRRLLMPAIGEANLTLAKAGIEPIGSVGLHGLRRTFASLRVAVGDDPVYVSAQIGHEDPTFTLRVYAQLVKAPRAACAERAAGVRVRVTFGGRRPRRRPGVATVPRLRGQPPRRAPFTASASRRRPRRRPRSARMRRSSPLSSEARNSSSRLDSRSSNTKSVSIFL